MDGKSVTLPSELSAFLESFQLTCMFFLLIFQKKKTLQATHQAQKRLRANGMEAYTIERDARARSLLPPPPQQPVPSQPLPSPPRTLRLPGTEHADYAVRAPDIDTDHLPPPPPPPASASPGTVRMRATPGGRVVYSARSDQLLRSPLVANKYDVSVWKSECWKNKPAKSFRSIRYSYFKKNGRRKKIYITNIYFKKQKYYLCNRCAKAEHTRNENDVGVWCGILSPSNGEKNEEGLTAIERKNDKWFLLPRQH